MKLTKGGIFGLAMLSLLTFLAIFAGFIAPHDPLQQQLEFANTPPVWSVGGSSTNVLGTDSLGRDILSRLIYGSRVSLLVAICGVAIASMLGMLCGILSGYFGGKVDLAITAGVNLVLSMPYILLVVFIATVVGQSLLNVILIFGFTDIPVFARVARGEVLKIRESTFIEAAVNVGVKRWRIMYSHLLPNLVGPLVTLATFEMSGMILYEAGLGFLGLSVPPSTPSWGNMINAGRGVLNIYPWIALVPGLAIVIAGFGFNMLGDWLRDALDPRSRRARQ